MSNEHKPGHRIAVISDTHNLLRSEVAEIIKTCELVLHGGDISGPDTLEKIRSLCGNYYVVRGNNDRDWASDIPYALEVELYGRKFFMTHKKKDIPSDVDADVVIYGHSHRYSQDYIGGTLYLNPGSCGPRPDGGTEKKSYGIIVERVDIPHTKTKLTSTSGVVCSPDQVTADLIRKIGTDLERHRTVADITARRNVSRELTEQIVRLYVTHPGVTAEQIMSKMGL